MRNGRNAERIFGWNVDSYCPISSKMPKKGVKKERAEMKACYIYRVHNET